MKSRGKSIFSAVELGMLLEYGRQIKGWSPAEAAIRIGVGENHIASMEHGDYTEFGHELEMLAVKLRIYPRKLDMDNEKIQSLISRTMSQLTGK